MDYLAVGNDGAARFFHALGKQPLIGDQSDIALFLAKQTQDAPVNAVGIGKRAVKEQFPRGWHHRFAGVADVTIDTCHVAARTV